MGISRGEFPTRILGGLWSTSRAGSCRNAVRLGEDAVPDSPPRPESTTWREGPRVGGQLVRRDSSTGNASSTSSASSTGSTSDASDASSPGSIGSATVSASSTGDASSTSSAGSTGNTSDTSDASSPPSGSCWSRSVSGLRSKFKCTTNPTPETTPGFFRFDVYTYENLEEVPSIWEGEGSHLTTSTLGKYWQSPKESLEKSAKRFSPVFLRVFGVNTVGRGVARV